MRVGDTILGSKAPPKGAPKKTWCVVDCAGMVCVTIGYSVIGSAFYINVFYILLPWSTLSTFWKMAALL
jgi:hypothetical protein